MFNRYYLLFYVVVLCSGSHFGQLQISLKNSETKHKSSEISVKELQLHIKVSKSLDERI